MKRTNLFLQVNTFEDNVLWISLATISSIEISERSGIWISFVDKRDMLRIDKDHASYDTTLSHLIELGILPTSKPFGA